MRAAQVAAYAVVGAGWLFVAACAVVATRRRVRAWLQRGEL